MPGQRMAAVDIGTNSCRLLIADIKGKCITPVLYTIRTTRIGEGLGESGLLGEVPMERTITALKEYLDLIREFKVAHLRVVATSAVREAANAAFFLVRLRETTGIPVDVISGTEEARLTYTGACGAVHCKGTGIVIDIGGGSTEFTYPIQDKGGSRLSCCSIPLGAVRLTEQPRLLSEIIGPMKDVLNKIEGLPHPNLVGVGGTITTLAAVDQSLQVYESERIQGYLLSKQAVERIMLSLAVKNSEERKKVSGLLPERADIIIAGTTILWAILAYLDAPEITVSEADLLHGIIQELQC
ncbi:MAG TPA: Ppx/GppA family phosphatase [Syntrophomonadaceae bacterium]|nr:Ppx/GppA family phosphatase [Syntrophomonadaceae bacterium]